MPSIVRLSTKELDELIESIEAEEGDATELIKLRNEFTEAQPQRPVADRRYLLYRERKRQPRSA